MKLIFSSSLGNVRQSYIQYKNMAAFIKIKKATITDQFLKTSSFKSFLTNEKSRSITLTIENIAFRSRVSNLTLMLDRWEEQKQENFSKRNKELFAPVLSTLIEIGNSYDLCQFFQNELPNFITENNLMISCGSFTTPGSDYGKIYDCASELSHYLCLDNYGPDSIIGNEIKQIKTFINEKQPKVLILIETISIYSNEIANFILKTEKERLEKKK